MSRLSDDDRAAIALILGDVPEGFYGRVDDLCETIVQFQTPRTYPNRSDFEKALESMRAHAVGLRDALDRTGQLGIHLIRHEYDEKLLFDLYDMPLILAACQPHDVYGRLRELEGLPGKDSKNWSVLEFLARLARAYQEYLGERPSAERGSKFRRLAYMLLDITNNDDSKPSRLIGPALKRAFPSES